MILKRLAKGTRVRAASIYGGVGYDPQLTALKEGFEVITATPGRFLDQPRAWQGQPEERAHVCAR